MGHIEDPGHWISPSAASGDIELFRFSLSDDPASMR